MRIPILLVIPLCLLIVSGVWWNGTRKKDFLTEPSGAKLAEIRVQVETANAKVRKEEMFPEPIAKAPEPAIAEVPAEEKPPAVDLGDLAAPPILEAYSERALDGHAKLVELAGLLEQKGEFQRALLAWERSIDLAKPSPSEAAVSIAAIRRLRPTLPDWNTDPNAALPVVLHAGTGSTLAAALKPVLEEAAREITISSAGLLKVTADLAVGKRMAIKGPVPVALWLAGPTKESGSTDVLSFTVASNEVLKDEIHKTIFQLVSSQLKREGQITPPAEAAQGETVLQALQSNVTRLAWKEFAESLNTPPVAAPVAVPVPVEPPR